jgi:hypothetical protein
MIKTENGSSESPTPYPPSILRSSSATEDGNRGRGPLRGGGIFGKERACISEKANGENKAAF